MMFSLHHRCRPMALLPAPLLLLLLMTTTANGAEENSTHTALLVYQVKNPTTRPAMQVESHCLLPADNAYQDILDLNIYPPSATIRKDATGQPLATVHWTEIPPRKMRALYVLLRVRFHELQIDVESQTAAGRPGPAGAGSDSTEPTLSEADRQVYLQDEWPFMPAAIQQQARQIIAARTEPLEQVRAFHDHLSGNSDYDIDPHFTTPEQVLAGRPASCSELAYTLIGLARSVGIPARAVPAFVYRDQGELSVDWLTHCWAEVFLPEVGWLPVDPTNQINHPARDFFGRQDARYLALPDDAPGQPDSPRWRVQIASSASFKRPLPVWHTAVWQKSADQQSETRLFEQACARLTDPDRNRRLEAVKAWEHHPMPLAGGFLLEALQDVDEQVRLAAAKALGTTESPALLYPLLVLTERETSTPVKTAMLASAEALLKIEDEEKRAAAVREAAKSRTSPAVDLLENIARDPAVAVRKAAGEMLYKLGDTPAVHTNYRILVRDRDDYVRIISALRWSRLESDEPLSFLVGHLSSRFTWDRLEAFKVLEARAGQGFGYNPRQWPHDENNRRAIREFRQWQREQKNRNE